MKLIIAEKPDQGKKLAEPFPHQKKQGIIEIKPCPTFPKGAYVTWAVGHLCELKPPEHYDPKWKRWSLQTLPMIPERFEHQVQRGKGKQFQVIKSLVQNQKVSEIIMAGDAGREGELIVRLILSLCRSTKPQKRLWISSLTKEAVKRGFQQMKTEEETRPLYYEALSRSCADWLVGLNASRAYTLLLKEQGIHDLFSTGRVQTPTLSLIVQREKEIINFKSKPFWEVNATFKMQGQTYVGTWHKKGETRILEKKMAEAISQFCLGKKAKITSVEEKKEVQKPPYLFNLSSLQATANKRYTFSPKKTLDLAQKLYVKGYLSYPRTDSSFITKEEARAFPQILEALSTFDAYKKYFPLPIKSISNDRRYVNPAKVTDHHAIIPTEQLPKLESLSKEEKAIYDLVVLQVIAAHFPSAIAKHTTIETEVDERATFVTKGKQMLERGWRHVLFPDEQKDQNTEVPHVEKGWKGDVLTTEVREGKTKPPHRFTEGQLITLMKTAGKYLEDEALEKVLMQTEGLGTEATRAGIISILKDRGYIQVTKNQVYATEKGQLLIEALGDSVLTSPEMTAKWEQRLLEIGRGEADPKRFMEQVKKLSQHLIEEAYERSKAWDFSSFDTSSIQRQTKRKSKGGAIVGTCKSCGGSLLDRGAFYGCAEYRKKGCTFTISKTILGKKISQANVKRLLIEGKTNVIKGFKKGEKTFQAALAWDEKKGGLTFLFEDKKDTST